MGKRKILPWADGNGDDKETKSKAPVKRQKMESSVHEVNSSPWNNANDDVKLTVADVIKNRALEAHSTSWETLRDVFHFALANKENAGLLNHERVHETTFEKFRPLGQLTRLAKNLYEKVLPEDTFAEDALIGDFWESTGADPIMNLRAAGPLFRLQSEEARSALIAGVLNLNDKAMKARCLKHMAEDPDYIDHIGEKDLKRLQSATSILAEQLNRDAPYPVNIGESARLLQRRIDPRQGNFGEVSGSQGRSSGSPSGQPLSSAHSPAPEDEILSIANLENEVADFAFDNASDEGYAKAHSIAQALMTVVYRERNKIILAQSRRGELENAQRSRNRSSREG